MAGGLRIQAEDYRAFYEKTRAMSGPIRTRVRKQLRDSGQKYGAQIVAEGADAMPRRGGLQADILAKGRKPTVSLTATGARLVLGKKKGPQIGRMNEGSLRHPAWHHSPDRKTWRWVSQPVPAGSWTEAAEKRMPAIRDDVATELDHLLKELN